MDRLIELLPQLWDATLETLFVATAALIFGGLAGLVLGALCMVSMSRAVGLQRR